jgi:hypothetical protein
MAKISRKMDCLEDWIIQTRLKQKRKRLKTLEQATENRPYFQKLIKRYKGAIRDINERNRSRK